MFSQVIHHRGQGFRKVITLGTAIGRHAGRTFEWSNEHEVVEGTRALDAGNFNSLKWVSGLTSGTLEAGNLRMGVMFAVGEDPNLEGNQRCRRNGFRENLIRFGDDLFSEFFELRWC